MKLELTPEVEDVAFRTALPSGKTARSVHRRLHQRITAPPGTGESVTLQQQHIGQLQSQNQRLLEEVQMWKDASLSFARELRSLRLG
jgi:hypothetical protein